MGTCCGHVVFLRYMGLYWEYMRLYGDYMVIIPGLYGDYMGLHPK